MECQFFSFPHKNRFWLGNPGCALMLVLGAASRQADCMLRRVPLGSLLVSVAQWARWELRSYIRERPDCWGRGESTYLAVGA